MVVTLIEANVKEYATNTPNEILFSYLCYFIMQPNNVQYVLLIHTNAHLTHIKWINQALRQMPCGPVSSQLGLTHLPVQFSIQFQIH